MGDHDMCAAVKAVVLNFGCGHAAANLKLVAHIMNLACDKVWCLSGCCQQHATGLCLAPLVKLLNSCCPCYRIDKLFRSECFTMV